MSDDRPTCETCYFWAYESGEDGTCRRFPPAIVVELARLDENNRHANHGSIDPRDFEWVALSAQVLSSDNSRHPSTSFEHWCGEHPDFPAWIARSKQSSNEGR